MAGLDCCTACLRRPVVSRGKMVGIGSIDLVSTFGWDGY